MAPHAPRTPSQQPSQEQPSPGLITLARGEQPEIDLEIKRSHFLARARRTDTMDEAREFIARVRSAYPDARHHCSAMTVTVLSESGAPTASHHPTERSNDDGEPSGTAGQPMLDVLRGTGLANTTVVVTRYFGGTLLGTGGLVKAYTEAAKLVLQEAKTEAFILRERFELDLSYEAYEHCKRVFKKFNIKDLTETFTERVHAAGLIETALKEDFEKELRDSLAGENPFR